MCKIREQLKDEGIRISLNNYDNDNISTTMEVSTIIKNKRFFERITKGKLGTGIKSIEDYYLFLLLKKISLMRECIDIVKEDDEKESFLCICDEAETIVNMLIAKLKVY